MVFSRSIILIKCKTFLFDLSALFHKFYIVFFKSIFIKLLNNLLLLELLSNVNISKKSLSLI